MLSIVVLLFDNGYTVGGNGVAFSFAPCASPSPTAFYNVACKLPVWYDLLFMMDFFIYLWR